MIKSVTVLNPSLPGCKQTLELPALGSASNMVVTSVRASDAVVALEGAFDTVEVLVNASGCVVVSVVDDDVHTNGASKTVSTMSIP